MIKGRHFYYGDFVISRPEGDVKIEADNEQLKWELVNLEIYFIDRRTGQDHKVTVYSDEEILAKALLQITWYDLEAYPDITLPNLQPEVTDEGDRIVY